MTYPKLEVTYSEDVAVIEPPDGEIGPYSRQAKYYPNRWEFLEDRNCLKLTYDDNIEELLDEDEAEEGRARITLYIPVASLDGWCEVW